MHQTLYREKVRNVRKRENEKKRKGSNKEGKDRVSGEEGRKGRIKEWKARKGRENIRKNGRKER